MKLSKQQIKQHESACDLLEKDILTYEEKLSVYENWIPAYSEQIGKIASYFTPFGMANDFQLCVDGNKIIDLCSGIGMLSFLTYHYDSHKENKPQITCVERSRTFVEVGKKLFPEANWIEGDVLDEALIKSLGCFDFSMSNPPFGKIKSNTSSEWLTYEGSEFEYKVIDIAAHISKSGSFIIPQQSAPFKYSGERGGFKVDKSDKYIKFNKDTGLDLEMNCGLDLSIYKDDWVGTSIVCEIVECEFPVNHGKSTQASLFDSIGVAV